MFPSEAAEPPQPTPIAPTAESGEEQPSSPMQRHSRESFKKDSQKLSFCASPDGRSRGDEAPLGRGAEEGPSEAVETPPETSAARAWLPCSLCTATGILIFLVCLQTTFNLDNGIVPAVLPTLGVQFGMDDAFQGKSGVFCLAQSHKFFS